MADGETPVGDELEALALALAETVGEHGAAILQHRRDLETRLAETQGDRDAATHLVGALLGILDGMGWEPTYAADRALVERARVWLSSHDERS